MYNFSINLVSDEKTNFFRISWKLEILHKFNLCMQIDEDFSMYLSL